MHLYMKTFPQAVTHNGQRCDVVHVDTDSFADLDDTLIEKAHAVCMHENKLLLVSHPEWNIWSIPGGTRESGETIDETLRREIQEETNCSVISSVPISYEKIIDNEGNFHYRVQYFCQVVPMGAFESDVAGNINKIDWVDPFKFEEYIEKKEFKKATLQRVIDNLSYYANL